MSEPESALKPPPKDCKACKGVSDLLDAFAKRSFSKHSTGDQDLTKASLSAPDMPPTSSASQPCPPNTTEIGHAAWTFLHTTAVRGKAQGPSASGSCPWSVMQRPVGPQRHQGNPSAMHAALRPDALRPQCFYTCCPEAQCPIFLAQHKFMLLRRPTTRKNPRHPNSR